MFKNILCHHRCWTLLCSVPAFVVFTDATLQAIVEAEPAQEAEFLAIPGVGHNKLLRYGTALQILLGGGSADDALMASAQGATQD